MGHRTPPTRRSQERIAEQILLPEVGTTNTPSNEEAKALRNMSLVLDG